MSAFAEDLQRLAAFKVFMRALPGWCRENGTSVSFNIVGNADEVEVGFGMPPEMATDAAAQSLMERLRSEERLMELELLVDEMRNVGVAGALLDPMIIEATELAHLLHPGVPFKLAERTSEKG